MHLLVRTRITIDEPQLPDSKPSQPSQNQTNKRQDVSYKEV